MRRADASYLPLSNNKFSLINRVNKQKTSLYYTSIDYIVHKLKPLGNEIIDLSAVLIKQFENKEEILIPSLKSKIFILNLYKNLFIFLKLST